MWGFCLQKKAFLISALVMGALFFLCSLVVFLGVKEQQGESEMANGQYSNTINENGVDSVFQLSNISSLTSSFWFYFQALSALMTKYNPPI